LSRVFSETIPVESKSAFDVVDVTEAIRQIVERSEIQDGILNVFCIHTSCVVSAFDDEKGIMEDLEDALEILVPKDRSYKHKSYRRNAYTHVRALIAGQMNVTVPIIDGKLKLGRYQKILFIELDGPRKRRKLVTQIIGD